MPAWLVDPSTARPRFLERHTAPPACIEAWAVDVLHARQVAAQIANFALWTTKLRAGAFPAVPLPQIMGWLEATVARLGKPQTTAPKYLWAVGHLWPAVRTAGRTKAWLTGLTRRFPLARLHRQLPSVPPARMVPLLRQAPVDVLPALTAMAAGLRAAEAVRYVAYAAPPRRVQEQAGAMTVLKLDPTGAGLKDDLGSTRLYDEARYVALPRATAQRVLRGWPTAGSTVHQRRLHGELTAYLHTHGVADIRAVRRGVGRAAFLTNSHLPAAQVMPLVRTVLGHRPGSRSTVRYTQCRLTKTDETNLATAALRRSAAAC